MQKKKICLPELIAAVLGITLLTACSSGNQQKTTTEVTIHELSDGEMLNPVNYSDATSAYIFSNMFQGLTSVDFKTLELVPVLATSRAQIEKIPEGGLLMTYQIRPEATWDNGTPITAKDVDFSLKVIKNPKVNNSHHKPYFEFITDIKFYDDDPKKFTFVCDKVYLLAEAMSGDFAVLPEYIYDPKGLMKGFTIKQLDAEKEKLTEDPKINEFAQDFNSEKRAREKEFISGSGAFKLAEWATGQRIVLERKKDWWGDKLAATNCYFEANANKLIFQTVNDQTSAIVSLKAGNLDVMYSIKAKDFIELPNSAKFKENFNAYTPMQLAYTYLGINTKLPKFQDKKVRQALAHLVDVNKLIKAVSYGLAERIIGPIHPSKKKDYNSDIVPYDYNIDKAKQMLTEAGWKDTNGDGTIDKVLNGEKTEFNIDFIVNAGNDARKQVALIFQEEARKVGITVNVASQDWSVYLDNTKKQNFELCFGSWVGSPLPQDFKQIFHTEASLNEGHNFVSFGNVQTDALIDSIREELDEEKRAILNKRFQQISYDEAAYIYLWAPLERMAIHKRFTNAEPSILKPGFWPAGFKVAPAASVSAN